MKGGGGEERGRKEKKREKKGEKKGEKKRKIMLVIAQITLQYQILPFLLSQLP